MENINRHNAFDTTSCQINILRNLENTLSTEYTKLCMEYKCVEKRYRDTGLDTYRSNLRKLEKNIDNISTELCKVKREIRSYEYGLDKNATEEQSLIESHNPIIEPHHVEIKIPDTTDNSNTTDNSDLLLKLDNISNLVNQLDKNRTILPKQDDILKPPPLIRQKAMAMKTDNKNNKNSKDTDNKVSTKINKKVSSNLKTALVNSKISKK